MKRFASAWAAFQEINMQRDREWDPEMKLDLSFLGNEMAGEVGEACNIIKKLERERLGIKGSTATTQDLKDELEDVLICVALVANKAGILLNPALKFNKTSEKYGLAVRMQE